MTFVALGARTALAVPECDRAEDGSTHETSLAAGDDGTYALRETATSPLGIVMVTYQLPGLRCDFDYAATVLADCRVANKRLQVIKSGSVRWEVRSDGLLEWVRVYGPEACKLADAGDNPCGGGE